MFQSINDSISKDLRPDDSDINPLDWEILSKYWYPVARVEDIGDEPIPMKLLDVHLVIFKSNEGVSVLVDRCPHRWIKLSTGTVKNGNIECPFHGMQYSGSGQCVEMPCSSSSSKIPRAYRVESFQVKEKYGLVWTCLDNSGDTDIPVFEGIDDCKLLYSEPKDWPVSSFRQIENFFDMAHLPLVHKGSVGGDPNEPIIPGVVTTKDDVVKMVVDYNEIPFGGSVRPVTYTHRVTLPFAADLTISDDTGIDARFIDVASPIGAFDCRVFQILVDTTHAGAHHTALIEGANVVNDEDLSVLANMPRSKVRLDGRGEVHLAVDNIALAYRKALRGLGLGK